MFVRRITNISFRPLLNLPFRRSFGEKISLRILSDIHLEFKPKIPDAIDKFILPINASKNIVGLLGDIGCPFQPLYKEFIEKISKKYDHVFLLTGNHEYYNYPESESANIIDETEYGARIYNMNDIDSHINTILKQYPNVTFLNNTYKHLYGYRFLGTTLWSDVKESNINYISKSLTDYKRIYINNNLITVSDTNDLHQKAIRWLNKELNNSYEPTIIFTHHSPLINTIETPTAHPIYRKSKNKEAFESNLARLMRPPVKFWGFGHTHFTTKFVFNDVVVSSNQLGYKHEKLYGDPNQIYSFKSQYPH